VYTHTAPLPTVNTRCIFFVTDAGIAESSATNRLMRAVGEREYIHDGLELADSEKVQEVKALLEKRRQK
jgi:hypothetical protein